MKKQAIIGPLVFIIIWAVVSYGHIIDPFFLPNPVATLEELSRMIFGGGIVKDIYGSTLRIVSAFLYASLFGIPIGLYIGLHEKIYRSTEFIIDFFRSIPSLALFPLFLIVFGIGDTPKIASAASSAACIIVFNVAYGIMNSKKSRLLAAHIMGATQWQLFSRIIFWESLPQTLIGLRTGIGWISAVIISAEMFVGTTSGIGHRIIDYQVTYNIPALYASICIAGCVGYILNLLFVLTEKKIVHWSGK